MTEDECVSKDVRSIKSPTARLGSTYHGNPLLIRAMVQEFNSNTTDELARVIIHPDTGRKFTMTMASESALFMFVFTFCLAGAIALFVLAVFILLHRLLVDDKYVASKTRINIIIVGYILCILLCIAAAILIIIGLAGLHQGIKLVLRNQTDINTVVNECPKSLTCQLEPVNTYLSEKIDKYFAEGMEALPNLKKRIDTLFEWFDYVHNARLGVVKIHSKCKHLKPLLNAANDVVWKTYVVGWEDKIWKLYQGSDAYNFWSNLRNANTSFNPLLAYEPEVKRLADEVEKRNSIIKKALNKSLENFVKRSCEIMEDIQQYKRQVDHYMDENEPSLRTKFRVPWLFLAITVILAICVCGIVILILRHYRFAGDSQTNKSQKHRVLFAVFDLAMEIAGHLALFIAILAFLSACYFLFTAYSSEFLCVGIFGNNSLATLNKLHEYNVENMEENATDTFNETIRECFARRSTYDSFIAQRWIFTEEFDNIYMPSILPRVKVFGP
ncbi:hypothetical protein GCK32_010869 [Trichostrongylus colubriformis]|uniref:Uncharacterized protein n=1 Tax=Trichostrongylus colubriformis TaxID=6319 RepID=A0AAN8IFK8_TRICO